MTLRSHSDENSVKPGGLVFYHGRAGRGEGVQEVQTGSGSGLAAAYVKRLGVAALSSLGWEPGKIGCQVALATGFLWGLP